MGVLWRRVSEAVRQVIEPVLAGGRDHGLSTFTATSNQRNEAMYNDAVEFSVNVQMLEQDLLAMERHLAGQFSHLREMLQRPLPRAWDVVFDNDAQEDRLVPQGDPAVTIGQNVDVERLGEALEGMRSRMQGEVFLPLQNWMAVFRRVQADMKRLEAVRLELDSRRRTVESLQSRLLQQRDKSLRPMGPGQGSSIMPGGNNSNRLLHRYHFDTPEPMGLTGPDPKLVRQIQDTESTKARKEQKLRATLKQFQEQEEKVFNSLHTLIMDASRLREYAACSIGHMKDCLSVASAAFEGTISNPMMATAQFSSSFPITAAAGPGAAPVAIKQQQAAPLQLTGQAQHFASQRGRAAHAAGLQGHGQYAVQQYDNPVAALQGPYSGSGLSGAPPLSEQQLYGKGGGAGQMVVSDRVDGEAVNRVRSQGQGDLKQGSGAGSARYQGGQAVQAGMGSGGQHLQQAGQGQYTASLTNTSSAASGGTGNQRRQQVQQFPTQGDASAMVSTLAQPAAGQGKEVSRSACERAAAGAVPVQPRPKPAPPAGSGAAPRGRGANGGSGDAGAVAGVAARPGKADRPRSDRVDRDAGAKADREWLQDDFDGQQYMDNVNPHSHMDQYLHSQAGSGVSGGGYPASQSGARQKALAAGSTYLAQQYMAVPVAQGGGAYAGSYNTHYEGDDAGVEFGPAGAYASSAVAYRSPAKAMAGQGREAAY